MIIDYPFDRDGFTPQHDLDRLDEVREQLGGKASARDNPTLVWLPTFFSRTVEDDLRQLVLIEHILSGSNPKRYLGHLRIEDQTRAHNELSSVRARKRKRVETALEQAFQLGPASAVDGGHSSLLDPSRAVDEHLVSLAGSQLNTRPAQAPTFARALDQLATRILDHQFPQHPEFGDSVTIGKLEKVRAAIERLLEAPENRITVDQRESKLLGHLGVPLGLMDVNDGVITLQSKGLRAIDQRRQQNNVEAPTVDHVRQYNDPAGDLAPLPSRSGAILASNNAKNAKRATARLHRPDLFWRADPGPFWRAVKLRG